MGKSDKPNISYRFFDHIKYIEHLIEKLNLKNITLVIHDWGSALGFHYAMRNEGNIKGIAFMEVIMKPFSYNEMIEEVATFYKATRHPELSEELILNQNILIEKALPGNIIRNLTEEEHNYYKFPFIDKDSRKPILNWIKDVPIDGEPADVTHVISSYSEWLKTSNLPKLLFYTPQGRIIPEETTKWCKLNLPNLKTINLKNVFHFLDLLSLNLKNGKHLDCDDHYLIEKLTDDCCSYLSQESLNENS